MHTKSYFIGGHQKGRVALIRKRYAVVSEILRDTMDVTEVYVTVEGKKEKAVNYNTLTGPIAIGDRVYLNTNAVFLKLGTGGYHFVTHNARHTTQEFMQEEGHILKLRYTPLQLKVMTVEEPDSPYHDVLKEACSINGMKVIIGSLHSMLYPLVYLLKAHIPAFKIVYIMTDSACLPISFSHTVDTLIYTKQLEATITCGQAFGGQYETVNIYTALLTAKHICNADIAIVIPGPGVVGTATTFGFSNIEEGHIIDAVNTLHGVGINVARISFADTRERHQGISHHTLTILSKVANTSAYVAIPLLPPHKKYIIDNQLKTHAIYEKHHIQYVKENMVSILEKNRVEIKTMGRNLTQDVDFFRSIGAAASLCLDLLREIYPG